jgi:hypothetical protein
VLAAITEYIDDWKVAAEFYGIANFHTLLENTGPWRQVLRAAEYGDPADDRDALESFFTRRIGSGRPCSSPTGSRTRASRPARAR